MRRWLVGLAVAVGFLSPGDSSAQDGVGQHVLELLRVSDVPGLQLTIIEGGALGWTRGYGVRNSDTMEPVDGETVFEAASLSKPVFAYVVLQLVDAGVVDLDRPLVEYYQYPDLAHDDRTAQVTARLVLSHSSGLPNWRPRGEDLNYVHQPGVEFQYSGEGFVYLQRTVEHITGEPLEALARRLVFEPLAMTRSSYHWANEPDANVAVGHGMDGSPRDKQEVADDANAAWSLHTTTADYGRFLVAVMQGRRLSDSLHAAMMSPQAEVAAGVRWGLGLGLEVGGDRGVALWHWGHNGGYRAFVLGYPADGSGLVMFSNSDNGMLLLADLLEAVAEGVHPSVAWLDYQSWDAPARLVRLELEEVINTDGIEAGISRYRLLRKSEPSEAFVEGMLNALGYSLLRAELVREATIVFQMNVAQYPAESNTHDSLGEAYFTAGDYPRALENYRRSVRLNPANGNGVMMIERVQKAMRPTLP
ncbi:MAG: serine hydrolase [Gemmatimonadetes bacterium]|nr:serine hydrolase [Gemmatimonadota bacterium]